MREGEALVAFVADDATTREVVMGPPWPASEAAAD